MWKPQIFENTRSQSILKKPKIVTTFTPWILEPLFMDDLITYEMGREYLAGAITQTRRELTSLGTIMKIAQLVREGGLEMDRRCGVHHDMKTGIVIDIAGRIDNKPVIITPWRLDKPTIKAHKKNIMKWVESSLGEPCFWVSIKTIRDNIPIDSSEISLDSFQSIFPLDRMFTVMRLIMNGSSMKEASLEMYPNVKSSYPYLSGELSSMKYNMGIEKKEISLLPYITMTIRRECHKRGICDYMDPRFLQFLEQKYATSTTISSFAIPWLRFMHDPRDNYYYDVLNPDMLSRFQAIVRANDKKACLFVDFETLSSVIYLCGIYVSGSETGHENEFHTIWSGNAYNSTSEKNLLLEMYQMKTHRFPDATIYFYHAERNMWKTACARNNIPLADPIARLFDDAIDLCMVLRSSGVLIRNVPNYKLKSIGKGLYEFGGITVDFPADGGIGNGEDSMIIARQLYSDPTIIENNHENNHQPTHVIDEDSFIASNDARRNLWVYNRYDCCVLSAIRDWLMTI